MTIPAPRKIVLVGGVAGGASFVTRMRRLDETAQILLIEKGEHVSFANCGLPYHIGETIQDRSKLIVQTADGLSRRFALERFRSFFPQPKPIQILRATSRSLPSVSRISLF